MVRAGQDPDSVWAAEVWAVVVAEAPALVAEGVREPAQEARGAEAEAVPAAKVCGGPEEAVEPVQAAAREAEAQEEDQGPAAGRVVVRVEDQEAVVAPVEAVVHLVADLGVGGQEPEDQAVAEVARVVDMVAVEEDPVARVAPAAQVLVEQVVEEAPERALPGNG